MTTHRTGYVFSNAIESIWQKWKYISNYFFFSLCSYFIGLEDGFKLYMLYIVFILFIWCWNLFCLCKHAGKFKFMLFLMFCFLILCLKAYCSHRHSGFFGIFFFSDVNLSQISVVWAHALHMLYSKGDTVEQDMLRVPCTLLFCIRRN